MTENYDFYWELLGVDPPEAETVQRHVDISENKTSICSTIYCSSNRADAGELPLLGTSGAMSLAPANASEALRGKCGSATELGSFLVTPPVHSTEPLSLADTIRRLGSMQVMLTVPTVASIRSGRPLRRYDDEIYVSQFVLQSSTRKLNEYLGSEEGKKEFHPFLGAGGSFGTLDDGSRVIYQTNGIARTEEPVLSNSIKCERTGAPGHYLETRMLVARRRDGPSGGMRGARSFTTRKMLEENLFYSFTSCWQIYACTATVCELGEEDSGERILVRRSVKDFMQHSCREFPVAKHLTKLLDLENETLVRSFSKAARASAMVEYQCHTLRGWQTYDFDDKPPEHDVGVQLVAAARIGHVAELKKLVLQYGCDCDTIISEFGVIGSGRSGCFTRSPNAFAEERTALIAAVEAGWLPVVEEIIDLAQGGHGSLDTVCHEWTPSGIGGECLRGHYTALDRAKLYHRTEIEGLLEKAKARFARECPATARENPFDVRSRDDKGEPEKGWQRKEHRDRYADFSFVEWGEDMKMDPQMQQIVGKLQDEIRDFRSEDASSSFKKLCLRWHPDKHPDDQKGLATRVFQWLQRVKDEAHVSRMWTA